MLDQYKRKIDYMRISVTDRCNLRCRYCMPADGIEQMACKDLLSYEEILRLCRIFAQLGIKKIKLTGGEPLVRLGICNLIQQIKQISGIEQVTITTNGVLLPQMAEELIKTGIDGINISLDTLQRDKFLELTRRDQVADVLAGIERLMELGYKNIKINCVPILEINGNQIAEIVGLAKKYPLVVRFIELMPIGNITGYTAIHRDFIMETLQNRYGELIPYQSSLGNGPASYFSLPKFKGKIGFIDAIHHKFCEACNRVRLTSNGFMKLCLQYNVGVDLKQMLRSDADDVYLKQVIKKNIYKKPLEHHFYDESVAQIRDERNMFQVGG